jgi:hypothetical protein
MAASARPRRRSTRETEPAKKAVGAERSTRRGASIRGRADVAQLVEHFTRNEGVRGSSPRVGFAVLPVKLLLLRVRTSP